MKIVVILAIVLHNVLARNNHNTGGMDEQVKDISLWINERQVKIFSGISRQIFAIDNGRVMADLKDPNFNRYLPIIPSELSYVNFTWASGPKKYYYDFYRLETLDESVLKPPTISIKSKGTVPKTPQEFSVFLPCSDEKPGIAMFSIGLLIQLRRTGKPLPGTPLRLSLKKECAHRGGRLVFNQNGSVYIDRASLMASQGPDPECDLKCGNNGNCTSEKICQCKEGYMGQYCQTALCYPQCMNGGNCTAPAVCSCPKGYQGPHCEGGICTERCLNGGKCIQKDQCKCPKGYYGMRCEISKCTIPCLNGGKCIGPNHCRCNSGFSGNHCEIGRRQRSICKKSCQQGICMPDQRCKCFDGWYGKYCRSEKKRRHRKH